MLMTVKSQKTIEPFLWCLSVATSFRNKSKSIVRFFIVLATLSVTINVHAQGLTYTQFADFLRSPDDMALAQRFGLEINRINSCVIDIQNSEAFLGELIENYESLDVFELADERLLISESLAKIKANCDVSIYDSGLPRNPMAENKFIQPFLDGSKKVLVGMNQVVNDLIHFQESSLNSFEASDWESLIKYMEQSKYSGILLSEYFLEYNNISMLATIENTIPAGVLLVSSGQQRIILGLELLQLKWFQETPLDNETKKKSISNILRGEQELLNGLKPLSKAVESILELSDALDSELSLSDQRLLHEYQNAAQKITNSTQVMVNTSRQLHSWINAHLEVGRGIDLDSKEYRSIEADLIYNSGITAEALLEFNFLMSQVQQVIQRIINL